MSDRLVGQPKRKGCAVPPCILVHLAKRDVHTVIRHRRQSDAAIGSKDIGGSQRPGDDIVAVKVKNKVGAMPDELWRRELINHLSVVANARRKERFASGSARVASGYHAYRRLNKRVIW